MSTIPTFALRREVALMGESFTAALGISVEDVEALWAQCWERYDRDTLAAINAAVPKAEPWQVFRAEDDCLSLWLGPQLLAKVHR